VRRILLAATLLLVAACASAQERVGPLPGTATSIREFEARLETLRAALGTPGMSAAIGANGRVAWTGRFGHANVESALAVRDTTSFHLASLTKLFGAIVVMRLVDSGLVSLDDPVSKFGVRFPDAGTESVLVRHLITMTSAGTPGQSFAYNGDRFAQLDQVIRRVSRKSFAELSHQWIMKPLALLRTAPNVSNPAFEVSGYDERAFRANLASPYGVVRGQQSPGTYPPHFSVAAGMISSSSDMIRMVQALQAGTLLKAELRDSLFAPTRSTNGTTLPYAKGVFAGDFNGVRVVWAYGLWTSISSILIHVPERGLTFVALSNSDRLSAGYGLGAGRLLDSPLAVEFLNAFVFRKTITLR
jgi:CubicO group peptidase (beta-lactamase class C family)